MAWPITCSRALRWANGPWSRAGDDGSYPFEAVKFLPEQGLEILFEQQPVEGPVVITQPTEGEAQYTLSCRLPEGHPLLEAELYLLYSGRFSASSLGLEFDPRLGEAKPFEASAVQMDWKITSLPTGSNQKPPCNLACPTSKPWNRSGSTSSSSLPRLTDRHNHIPASGGRNSPNSFGAIAGRAAGPA